MKKKAKVTIKTVHTDKKISFMIDLDEMGIDYSESDSDEILVEDVVDDILLNSLTVQVEICDKK